MRGNLPFLSVAQRPPCRVVRKLFNLEAGIVSWTVLLMLCSLICLIAMAFSGVIYSFRITMNRARRLELGSRQKVLAVIPEEYRARSNREATAFVFSGLLILASIALVENLYPPTHSSPESASGGFARDVALAFAMASLMFIPFMWQWALCFRRSHQKVAELGKNPFHLSQAQRWLLFGNLFFMWLLEEMSLIEFDHFIEAACGLPLLVVFLVFAAATKSQMSWQENGLFLGTRFYTWDEITWYRWYENRCGIMFGHSRWQFPCPVQYLPAEEIGSDRLEELLNRYLPAKERETVESYLEVQDRSTTDAA